MSFQRMSSFFYSQIGKRCFDVACSAAGLILLAPFLLIITAVVLVTSGAPAFFRQERTGLWGKPFLIWKFRTMTVDSGPSAAVVTAADDSRITPFGRWLRRSKFDELPQLYNVLKGEMSLVGPRPEVPYYTQGYSLRQRAIFQVRPGITSPAANEYISEETLLAQAHNKEQFYVAVLLPKKIESDLAYAQHISFHRDLKLIANTFLRLLVKSRNIQNLHSHAAQPET